jgi:cell division protease FtsH
LHAMADALMEYETLDPNQLDDIMAGAKPRAPDDTPPASSSGKPQSGSQPGADERPIGGPAEEA